MFLDFSVNKKLHASSGIIDLDVQLSIGEGEIVTIFGKSGAGKTTILRILAGLTLPDSGSIHVGNQIWYHSKTKVNLSVKRRSTGFVFQDYALFPNMSVRENLEFAYKDKKRVDELLDFVKLINLQHRMPQTLSGGQKQRVALARSLVKNPKLLLLDEPLSALDIDMRQELQDLILKINKELNVTIILVSHDLAEIFKLSERVYIIDEGKIINGGIPSKVFAHESFSAKFQFIGEILEMKKADTVYIVVVLVGNNLIKVIATIAEVANFEIGEKVIVGSKAFNPILQKMDMSKFGRRIKNIWFPKNNLNN
ncbi:MAG: ABC transporter ATP-binding protein [Bacteroidota bacterium]